MHVQLSCHYICSVLGILVGVPERVLSVDLQLAVVVLLLDFLLNLFHLLDDLSIVDLQGRFLLNLLLQWVSTRFLLQFLLSDFLVLGTVLLDFPLERRDLGR